jgi:hypothetical protein
LDQCLSRGIRTFVSPIYNPSLEVRRRRREPFNWVHFAILVWQRFRDDPRRAGRASDVRVVGSIARLASRVANWQAIT